MNFANPAWFLALILLLPLIGLRFWAHLSNRRNLFGLVAPRLHSQLVVTSSTLQTWLSFFLILVALALIITAMARPQWGFQEIESYSEGRSLIIAIDTSRSMLATDLVPNRLVRAKLAARDIVDALREDRIGLIAFAGKSFLQAPLTNDHEAIIESIDQIDTELIPRGGTNLTEAASLALESFKEANSEQNALIIFSDGEALEGQGDIARIKEAAAQENMVIITVGVGSEAGSIIPEPGVDGRPVEGAFIKDEKGQVVRSRLDATALRSLASGGHYFQLGDRNTLDRLVETVIKTLGTTREKEADKKLRPIERFMWPLGAGLACLFLSHLVNLFSRSRRRPLQHPSAGKFPKKRKVVSTSAAVWILASGCSLAETKGWDFLKRENYPSAFQSFESEVKAKRVSDREKTDLFLGLGNAAYRLGKLDEATKAYGQALILPAPRTREQAHYNLGNTLYRIGESLLEPSETSPNGLAPMTQDPKRIGATLRQWIGALEHYEAALEVNPDNADARHNAELLKKKIEELKKQQEEQEKKNQEQKPQKDKSQDEKEKSEDQKDKSEDQKDKSEDQKDKSEDQKDKSGDQKDKSEDSKDKSEDPSEEQQKQDQEEGDSEEEKQDKENGEQESSEQKNPGESGKPESAENQPGGENEPEMPPDPGDGELSTENDEKNRPPDEKDSKAVEAKINPQTGYSPAQARQLIEALANENGELRPVYPGAWRAERYKNW